MACSRARTVSASPICHPLHLSLAGSKLAVRPIDQFGIRLLTFGCAPAFPAFRLLSVGADAAFISCTCSSRTTGADYLAPEIPPRANGPVFLDPMRSPIITFGLRDSWNVCLRCLCAMTRATQYAAIFKSSLSAKCIWNFVVIAIIALHEFSCAAFAMSVRTQRGSSFDLGGKFGSHFGCSSILAMANHRSPAKSGQPPKTLNA